MNNHGRWRIGALASAVALFGSLASLQAHALALGRITVQSALGEPLRAEIDMADVNAEEASSLRVGVAPAEIFKAAGLEYTAAVTGLEVKLQRRADGRPYLRLSSNRAITEPFVDLILETSGSAGRITRDYTMLFDPPKLRGSAGTVEPGAALITRAPVAVAAVPVRQAAFKPSSYYPDPTTLPAARSAPLVKAPVAQPNPSETMPVPSGNKQVVVRPGDTASRIAARNKPDSVSLDQMLAALLKSNPDAFIGGNINIIKSGAVLDIPGMEADSVLIGEARTLVTQSKDFNAFRRNLAQNAPAAQVAGVERQAGGKVQTTVDDRVSKTATPDKLTLSSGAVQARPATPAEEKIAAAQNATDASSRIPEPSKNSNSFTKLDAAPLASAPAPVFNASSGSAVSAVAPASVPVAINVAAAAMTAAAALPASAAANGSAAPFASASEPALAASAAAVAAPSPVKKPGVPATAPAQAGLFDQALNNPLLLPGAGGLIFLAGGLLFARYRKNKRMGHVDSSFLESRLQPDSFFGASGGQRIDTRASIGATTNMGYSPSQIDPAGDVDPVAEADVYLAYGRDQQAEEILKEAMRTHPARVAIHAKLAEIYAKRRDSKAFDSIALEAFRLTQGNTPEWAYITQLGRDLSPANSLYRSRAGLADSVPENGVSTFTPPNAAAAPASEQPTITASLANAPDIAITASVPPVSGPGLAVPSALLHGLDLDLDVDIDSAPVPLAAMASCAPLVAASPSALMGDLDFDLDLDIDSAPVPLTATAFAAPIAARPSAKTPSLEIDSLSGGLDFTPQAFIAPPASRPDQAPNLQSAHSGMLEFDMGSLSLELGPTTPASAPAPTAAPEDPLEIKFLLAEEFRILGDADGARALADEVLTKARGPLKVKAQAFLNTLS